MPEQSNLLVHKNTLPFLNVSLYLNNIKPIQSVTIENRSSLDSLEVCVKISSDIPCIEPFTYNISHIPSKKEIKIPLSNLQINRDYLNRITETEMANITIEVFEKDFVCHKDTFTLNVHSIEYFGGFQVFPELIASYVTPNHPYIYHIKRKAVEILSNKGLKTAFEGYQKKDSEGVLQIISAIYSAIQNEGIVYSSMPPGYEETGQRLRLLNTIQNEKFANCIDMSLLFAACLEAVDLNPILIIVKGHAFVGCWLQDEKFSEAINDDKSAITKRLSKGIREIAAIEATSLCKGNNVSFTDALNIGEAHLVENEDFIVSVDIKRARTLRIRPIPLMSNSVEARLDYSLGGKLDDISVEKDFEIGTIYDDELQPKKQIITKQKIWERKLLDLSLRNNLLNLHFSRNILQLVDIDISHLEDVLSEGKSFTILPNPNASVLKKYNLYNNPLHDSSSFYQLANDELKLNRLYTYFHEDDLENILSFTHKNAKLSIEENGSSTLYLAVGLLKWYDKKALDQPRYAPILLVPVELNRRSVNSKFTLKSREEETMINITLIEFLRQEYELNLSGLEELPIDEKGVDVAKVMGILRRAIMQLKGWDVHEQLVLGNFSFSKLILWKDIVKHQADLLKSDMVRSLVEGKLVFPSHFVDQPDIDLDKIKSQSIILPIPTDTSQLEAVLTAQNGVSFILHGPPGTGKSQTITNIIADALFHGKRVLFVAAKKAALDVVHKRLEQIGLAPFTLELHSNKSKKSDVLEQLAKAIETLKVERIADFQNEGERLDLAKNAISEYVNLLHKKQKVGWSLYDSISSIDNKDSEKFGKKFIADHTLELLDAPLWQQWKDWLPQFQSISNVVVHPSQNALRSFDIVNFTPAISDEISAQTQTLLGHLPDLFSKSQRLAESIKFPYSINKREEWERFCQIVTVFEKLPNVSLELLEYLADSENYTIFEEWMLVFTNYQTSFRNITKNFNQEILDIDVLDIEKQWKIAQQSWFIPKWIKSRNIKKTLSSYSKTALVGNGEIDTLFLNHSLFRSLQKVLEQNRFTDFQKVLKNLYRDDSTDLSDIEFKAKSIKHIGGLSNYWGYNSLSKWAKVCRVENLNSTFEIFNSPTSGITDFMQLVSAFTELKNNYEKLTGFGFTKNEDWILETTKQLWDIQTNLPNLKNWINYVQLRKQAEKLSLQWLINDFESNLCSSGNLENYFNFIVHISISQKIISQHEALSLFSTDLFESKINHYKKIAREFQYLTIKELRHKLAAQLPNTTSEAMQSSEINILQRAIKNKGRGLSIRKLFDQIPTLLPRIAPCMLMSPISVAQYFDVNSKHFDILIFDEASQLPTCEAVSALARAKQCVIVGDPKQMPPTSFFSTVKYDEENTEVEDLESILEDCLSLSVPSKYLSRHYRSKHESLIAFSNANYYENKLLTFPSSDDLNRKVKYHRVDGYYDKGKTCTNSFEADKIVQYIKAHYNNPEKRKYSIGVVTFSQTQQGLIEEKLQKLFISEPNLEELTLVSDEPLFVKNLENVQGDERDIILFSVCYASTEDGSKPSMNFGPLNRNGGWRRLNVAVTRARYEMHIFATLHADQIDLSRTSAEGVAGLKAFLQFAEKGQLSFRPEDLQDMQSKRHLSEAISRKLQHRGLLVKCNIGTSGFKVDIGIINPNKPEQYVLGLIIDGHYYFNAQTANDREMVMPSVLKALGWNIYRVWSLDWHENSEKIINDIVDKFQILLTQPDIDEENNPPFENEIVFEPIKMERGEEIKNTIESKQKEYDATNIRVMSSVTSENFLEFKNRNIIKNQILSIVNTEAPISKSLLYKKVLVSWNTSRAGSRIDKYLEEILSELQLTETIHDQPFYWNGNTNIDFYRNNEVEKRNMEDIAPEEVIVALEEVVTNYLSIEEDELLRYLARTFSFAKVGRQIDHHLRYSIDMAIRQGKIRRDFNRIKLADK
ncbi:MAG TPA: DUF3320 domain-containing protein [Leadbetterella sp.]|nr:DUF3320 domain-containing protein [Leadbetterella sp.]